MLASGPVLLSGGLGTELQRRGCDTRLPLWAARALLEAPDAVRDLHADYVRAGARVVTANTFRTDPRTVERAGLDVGHAALTRRAVELAFEGVERAGCGEDVLVSGSVGPLEDCYRPDRVPGDARLRDEHAARARAIADAGADWILVETMNTIREAVAALEAARRLLPACVSFTCAADGRLLSGEDPARAAAAVDPLAPEAILVNCCAPAAATRALARLRDATDRPLGAYANGVGRPDPETGWRFAGGTTDDDYVREAERWLASGAVLVGGCCGTTPSTIRRLAERLRP